MKSRITYRILAAALATCVLSSAQLAGPFPAEAANKPGGGVLGNDLEDLENAVNALPQTWTVPGGGRLANLRRVTELGGADAAKRAASRSTAVAGYHFRPISLGRNFRGRTCPPGESARSRPIKVSSRSIAGPGDGASRGAAADRANQWRRDNEPLDSRVRPPVAELQCDPARRAQQFIAPQAAPDRHGRRRTRPGFQRRRPVRIRSPAPPTHGSWSGNRPRGNQLG